MTKRRLLLWAAAMWITPALVAGMLGWPGIWGGGTAFSDLILPVPITGGIIHMPTFVLAIFLVRAYPDMPAAAASILRAGLFGAALIGLARLVDLDRIALSLATDLPLRRIPWQHDYFGLCLMMDALWTLPWTANRPELKTHAWTAAAIATLLPAGYLFTAIGPIERRVDEPFMMGMTVSGSQRGDENQVLYTTRNVSDPGFRAEARAAAERLLMLPEQNGVVEDLAIYFTDSLEAAKGYELDRVLSTLCVYEDGTPDRWMDGQGDCFSDHVTFSERLSAAYDDLPRGLPLDVQAYLAARVVCPDVALPPERDRRHLAEYRCYDLDTEREQLRANYSGSEFEEFLSENR